MVKDKLSIHDSVAYHINRSSRLLRAHLLRRIRELGYDATPEQWFILNKLYLKDGQSQTELCDSIFADRPNITRIIDAMERKKWVIRKVDSEDSRRKLVSLSKVGKQVGEAISAMAAEERSRIFKGLSVAEIKTTKALLKKLEGNLQNELG